MNISIPDNWYESFFSGINCEMWEKTATQQWTDAEVTFIEDILNVNKGSHLLDVPCGTGRHSIELAKHGYKVTGVDISDEFINGLKKKVDEQQLTIEIIQGNILSLELQGNFDGAFSFGNSFGYFMYQDMQTFVEKVAAALKPGAKWIINSGLMAESFLAKSIKEKTYELDGLTMKINNEYDEWNSCLLTTLTYTKDNKREVHQFKHHVYTIAEVIRLLQHYNLKTTAIYNSTGKEIFHLGDPQVYLVAEKC
jgi:cyclopropane fatty-acyl-phospholipid synthase-like methyltransferase